jgi:hypothetical protein
MLIGSFFYRIGLKSAARDGGIIKENISRRNLKCVEKG